MLLTASSWRPPTRAARPIGPPGPVLTPAEKKSAQRERARCAAESVARSWLDGYLNDEDDPAEPGARIIATDLYALAVEAIDDLAEEGYRIDDKDDESPTYKVPGRTLFYTIADEVLGPRRRVNHGSAHAYIIPKQQAEAPTMNLDNIRAETEAYRAASDQAERLIRRREQLASGDYLGALTEQRETAATGTDGPIDLGAHRARQTAR